MNDKPKVKAVDDLTGKEECFVIMPISDTEGYCSGHFKRVYEDIFVPAIKNAGFVPYRADEDNASNLIQLSILRKLIESPMAICDLSTRNPNVMFELGIRQAFDKPVVLVQEEGTPKIFDISQFRYTEYRKARLYHEVLDDQEAITKAIKSTYAERSNPKVVNSIIRLLGLTKPAKIDNLAGSELDTSTQFIIQELQALRSEIRNNRNLFNEVVVTPNNYIVEPKRLEKDCINVLSKLKYFINNKDKPIPTDLLAEALKIREKYNYLTKKSREPKLMASLELINELIMELYGIKSDEIV